MLRKNTVVAGIVLVILLVIGGLLLGLVGDDTNSDLDGWLVIFGFLLFVGSIGGIIALVIGRFPKGMTTEDGRHWKQVRIKAKWAYVRKFVLMVAIPVIVGVALSVFLPGYEPQIPFAEVARNHIVLAVVIVGCALFAALSFWNDRERQYAALDSQIQNRELFKDVGDETS